MADAGPFVPPEGFNIASYFLDARVEEGLGEKAALLLDHGAMTYRQVQVLANRAAQALGRAGVRQEERVMVALPDGADFVAALFGTFKLGAVAVMVNPGLKEEEVAALLTYVRPSVAVVAGTALPVFTGAAGRGRWPRRFLVSGEGGGAGVEGGGPHLDLAAELAAGADDFDNVPTHRDDPALWLFSGGTTGRPKAVVQSHRSYANTTELYAKGALGYRPDDVTLSVPKLFFGYATGSNLFFPFAVGACAALFPEPPTPEGLFERIRRHRATILINVPTMIQRMVSHPGAAAEDLSSLRFATSAGEALPAPLHHRWVEAFGVELLDGLGTAEMWHIFLTNLPGQVRPGTLGRAVPGFEVRVCDEEGRELPRGEVGRLWVRGGSRAWGYWQSMEKTAEAFRGEWFVGGDLVQMDDDGYITYCGRGDDVLKVAGKWLVPSEVESCLLEHPAVEECAVVGVENEEGLTKPFAFVVARGGDESLEEELKVFALERLQAHKHPRRVIFLEALPRTHLGKVDRGKLRQMT